MKPIKFDLPINGTKVKNLEELRDNLTDEILALASSTQLERWLRTRQLPEQAQAVLAAVQREDSDKRLFLALCEVLEVEAHPDDVKAIFDEPPPPGRLIYEARYLDASKDLMDSNLIRFSGHNFVCEENEFIDLEVPQLSESVNEATLLQWKKQIGKKVLKDEIVIEIETDKVVLEVPAPSEGVLHEILVRDGGVVASGQVIGRLKCQF